MFRDACLSRLVGGVALILAAAALLLPRQARTAGVPAKWGWGKEVTNSIGMKLVRIPAGTFLMGSTKAEGGDDNERPQHEVTIRKAFYMGAYPVTQEQYKQVMGRHFSSNGKLPAEKVGWHHAVNFCERLSARTEEKAAGREYWLPTEAEWEYACRAGTMTRYHSGDGEEDLKKAGWYERNSGGRTHTVGRKAPNKFGLFDMHGNVWQWCDDWYGEDHYRWGDREGPASGRFRVLRGGSWFSRARDCRAAYRMCYSPEMSLDTVGFRVVCIQAGSSALASRRPFARSRPPAPTGTSALASSHGFAPPFDILRSLDFKAADKAPGSSGAGPSFDKYLLDDTEVMVVINFKHLLSAPGSRTAPARARLKDSGLGAFEHLDRMVICLSRANGEGDERVLLIQGKFDPTVVKSKLTKLADLLPGTVSSSTAPGGNKVYCFKSGRRGGLFAIWPGTWWVAQLDATTIVLASQEKQVLDALLKASGKKTTKFAYKEVQAHLKKLKTDVAVQGFVLESALKGGLDDYKEVTLTVNVKDKAQYRVALQVAEKEKVKELLDGLTSELAMLKSGNPIVDGEPEAARLIQSTTVKSSGQTILIEGKVDVEVLLALLTRVMEDQ
jgi:formylglycine-generating enzyme required for sulfatase activity